MPETQHITIDGQRVAIEPGDTILQAAARHGIAIPTLCNDSRLAPVGACRTCLVEIDGQRRLLPSCTVPATNGLKVSSESDRVKRHRKALLSLYMTDHPPDRSECETGARCQLHEMADAVGASSSWPSMPPVRTDRPGDRNPYVEFRADRCIACARCTRYCDEIEGVNAIALIGRGSHTTISTADDMSLLDSTCELCGGCIDVCPTGAMTEKIPLVEKAPPENQLTKVRTTCNYCGVGCQMDLNVDRAANEGRGRVVKVTSPETGTYPNDGNLCVKGRFAYQFVHHQERLTQPLVRDKNGQLQTTSWEDALARAAEGLGNVRRQHGNDALAFVSSSRCTGEENFLVQKLARAVYATNNVHQCAAT